MSKSSLLLSARFPGSASLPLVLIAVNDLDINIRYVEVSAESGGAGDMGAKANAAVQAVLHHLVADCREIGIQVSAYQNSELAGRPVDGVSVFAAWSVIKALAATTARIQAA
jgi:hypothetical protein